jgi:hypothetical protein
MKHLPCRPSDDYALIFLSSIFLSSPWRALRLCEPCSIAPSNHRPKSRKAPQIVAWTRFPRRVRLCVKSASKCQIVSNWCKSVSNQCQKSQF